MYNFKKVKNNHRGLLILAKAETLLKVTLLYEWFSRFLNCANGTKLRNTSQMDITASWRNWEKKVKLTHHNTKLEIVKSRIVC